MASKIFNANNIYLLIFGSIMLVGLMFLAWMGSPPVVAAVGQPLPKLDLQPLVETEQEIVREDVLGKIAVLHFWGTWCGPCVREYPEFAALANRYRDAEDVRVISVSSSPGPESDLDDLRSKTVQFMQERQAVLPTHCDPVAMTRGQLALLLPNGSFSYPTTLLVDPRGIIVESFVGSAPGDMQRLATRIEALR